MEPPLKANALLRMVRDARVLRYEQCSTTQGYPTAFGDERPSEFSTEEVIEKQTAASPLAENRSFVVH